ncbi:hypothetical protein P389DRAFT_82776 [Cystobasidium minutum MCA 4210]|uniref:uncharacterized protein n=1 Tax=Cystobasidium minutum MCA 4210 TaxID=1397322 RepID=UPI0034CE6A57|eukprot:jgi/Rhomi1/82776/CE82775_74
MLSIELLSLLHLTSFATLFKCEGYTRKRTRGECRRKLHSIFVREVRSTSLSFENIEAERDYILRFKMGGLCAGGLSLLSFLLLAKGSWILQTSML